MLLATDLRSDVFTTRYNRHMFSHTYTPSHEPVPDNATQRIYGWKTIRNTWVILIVDEFTLPDDETVTCKAYRLYAHGKRVRVTDAQTFCSHDGQRELYNYIRGPKRKTLVWRTNGRDLPSWNCKSLTWVNMNNYDVIEDAGSDTVTVTRKPTN